MREGDRTIPAAKGMTREQWLADRAKWAAFDASKARLDERLAFIADVDAAVDQATTPAGGLRKLPASGRDLARCFAAEVLAALDGAQAGEPLSLPALKLPKVRA